MLVGPFRPAEFSRKLFIVSMLGAGLANSSGCWCKEFFKAREMRCGGREGVSAGSLEESRRQREGLVLVVRVRLLLLGLGFALRLRSGLGRGALFVLRLTSGRFGRTFRFGSTLLCG